MKTIYKYPLNNVYIKGPITKYLSVQTQHGIPCLWAEVDTDLPDKNYLVSITGTGLNIPNGEYIGTIQNEYYVYHYYLIEVHLTEEIKKEELND